MFLSWAVFAKALAPVTKRSTQISVANFVCPPRAARSAIAAALEPVTQPPQVKRDRLGNYPIPINDPRGAGDRLAVPRFAGLPHSPVTDLSSSRVYRLTGIARSLTAV